MLVAVALVSAGWPTVNGWKRKLISWKHIDWIHSLSCIRTCWWCASVCFISTIRMLCSMAYFFALATKSCWSDVNFGSAPLKMPSSGDREPGPNSTSPSCRRSFNGALINGIFGCQSENMKITMFINKPQAHAHTPLTFRCETNENWSQLTPHPKLPKPRWWNFSHFESNSDNSQNLDIYRQLHVN